MFHTDGGLHARSLNIEGIVSPFKYRSFYEPGLVRSQDENIRVDRHNVKQVLNAV